jgi:ketosteroid isomerase-like protein
MTDNSAQAVAERFLKHFTAGELQAAQGLLADSAVIDEPHDLPYSGRYLGPAGLVQFFRKLPQSLKIRIESSEVSSTGDTVVVRLKLLFESRKTARCVRMDAVELYTVTAGKISSVDVYYKGSAAIRELIATA